MNATSGFQECGVFFLAIISISVHARATTSTLSWFLAPFPCKEDTVTAEAVHIREGGIR